MLIPFFSSFFSLLILEELDRNALDFNTNVTSRIRAINSSVIQSFSNLQTALYVTEVIYVQLATAYNHFLDLHDKYWGKDKIGQDYTQPMSIEELWQILGNYQPKFTAK